MKKLLLLAGALIFSTSVFASPYQIYQQSNFKGPKMGILTQQNSGQFVKIYQHGSWVKIANQANGKVGWINTGRSASQARPQAQNSQLHRMLTDIRAQRAHYARLEHRLSRKFAEANRELNQKEHAIIKQLRVGQKTPHYTGGAVPAAPLMMPAKGKVSKQFSSVSIKYNNDGKTAAVTEKWLGKDGKMHTTTKQMPIADLQQPGLPKPAAPSRLGIHWTK